MANKGFWIKMLVIVLVFGMATVGCYGQSMDSRLNGTWVSSLNDGKGFLVFNNGTFEGGWDGVISQRGNYTTNAGKITIQYTFSTSVYNEAWSYSINNNTLTIIFDDDPEPYTYTRKE